MMTVYDPDGRSIRHSRGGAGGSWTTLYLDGFGRLEETDNSLGIYTRNRYDTFGRKTFESLPYTTVEMGTTFFYDDLDRVVEARTADGKSTLYDYVEAIDVRITDAENHVTVQDWAAFGDPADAWLLRLVDAKTRSWSFGYTGLGKLASVNQPGDAPNVPSRTWFYTGDVLDREVHPESGTTTYVHNAGRLGSGQVSISGPGSSKSSRLRSGPF